MPVNGLLMQSLRQRNSTAAVKRERYRQFVDALFKVYFVFISTFIVYNPD